ncbi:hypothetical protein RB195_003672 [Necator americanus]
MPIAVVIVIPLLLLHLPSSIFGDQINVEMKKDGNSSKQTHVHPAIQEELLRGCEEVIGLDLAVCIVNRFAEDLQMKQNQHLDLLKKTEG